MKTVLLAIAFLVLATAAQATNISWIDNSDNEDGFRIYRAVNALSAYTVVGTVAANVTSFLDTVNTPGTCWRITAFNSIFESQPSNIGCLAQSVITVPVTPTGISVVP